MSELTLSTVRLQNLVTRSMKGAGYNKLLPITSMVGISCSGNDLVFTTSDGANHLYVSMEIDTPNDFDVTVDAETFFKLVTKLTSEQIDLEVTDKYLFIKGNGEYKIPLQINDDGEHLKYPNPLAELPVAVDDSTRISKATVDVMLNSLKPSLSQNIGSVYSGYFVGDCIATTDRAMLCVFDDNLFDKPILFNRNFVDLLGLVTEDVSVELFEDNMTARSGDITIYTKANYNTEDFNIDKVKKLLDIEVDSYCKINKQTLLSTLERLSIFVGKYDDSAINLCFDKTGVDLISLNNDGVEHIEYMESKNAKEFEIKIAINRLITQLKAYASDSVEIYYGDKGILKLKDGKLTQIIALML